MTHGPTGVSGGSHHPADEASIRFAGLAAKKKTDWAEPAGGKNRTPAHEPNAGGFRRMPPETPANSNRPQSSSPLPRVGQEEYLKAAIERGLNLSPAAAAASGFKNAVKLQQVLGGYAAYNLTGRNPCGTTVMPCASSALGLPVRPQLGLTGQGHTGPLDHLSITYGMPEAGGDWEKDAPPLQPARVTVLPDDLRHEAIPPDGRDANGQAYWNLATIEAARDNLRTRNVAAATGGSAIAQGQEAENFKWLFKAVENEVPDLNDAAVVKFLRENTTFLGPDGSRVDGNGMVAAGIFAVPYNGGPLPSELFKPTSPEPLKDGPIWYVHSIAVKPEYQGKGIAGKLLRDTIFEARQKGYSNLTLEAYEDNKPARTLYLRKGFADISKWEETSDGRIAIWSDGARGRPFYYMLRLSGEIR